MKFKIDENLPHEFSGVLRDAGHDAMTVLEEKMAGISDQDLIALCQDEDRILMSLDMDFTDIRLYPPVNCPGVLVFRLQSHDKRRLLVSLDRILSVLALEPISHRLWIVGEDGIRIRE